jgi:D-3-phosphoglycerate dehydrogenase / 2-oxoglutarate reductase
MAMFKVIQVVNDALPMFPDTFEKLTNAGIELVVHMCSNKEDLERYASDADLVWSYGGGREPLKGDNLTALKRCGAILRSGSGVDNIDVKRATALGIIVANTPDAVAAQVADHAISLLFSHVRQVTRHDRLIRRGIWDARALMPQRHFDGATLGLVAFGRIPRLMVRKLAGFGMRVLACDPFVSEEVMAAAGVRKATQEEVFQEADYVSVHAPLNESTLHLVDARHFRLMKPTALFVNTSRGPVVNEADLIQALENGQIAGAALDVFEREPLAADSPLLQMENVLLTPHMGGMSDRNYMEFYEYSMETIFDLAQHRWPRSIVNPEVKPRWDDMRPR